MSESVLKVKKFRIETEKGTRALEFRPVPKAPGGAQIVCTTACPYGVKVCSHLIDPRHPNDKLYSFQDFCCGIGRNEDATTENEDELSYVPASGTLEANLYDVSDCFQNLISENKFVKVNEVIDAICQDTCPNWNKDHTECNTSNHMCILYDLFKNREYKLPAERDNNVDQDKAAPVESTNGQ